MIDLDITTTNAAIERLLERTENPRHRFLLRTYHRHRYLEIAGRYEEIFVPEMTVDEPVYRFYTGGVPLTLSGRDAIKDLYALWTRTAECIFYAEDEQLAVGDDLICSNAIAYQQHPALALVARGHLVDDLEARRTCAARASSWCGATTRAAGCSARTSGSSTTAGARDHQARPRRRADAGRWQPSGSRRTSTTCRRSTRRRWRFPD